MDYQEKSGMAEYYKIMLVSLNPDACRVLKGPEPEKKLAEILRDDYHSSRYEKMTQLVIREMVAESEQESISDLLSLEHLQEELGSGVTKVTCSYMRKIDGVMQQVSTAVFPRRFGQQGELVEFMIYVSVTQNQK